MNARHEEALRLAGLGVRVLPLWGIACSAGGVAVCRCRHADKCGHPGKHPLIREGARGASTDTATLGRWWSRAPWANVGAATGDGVLVVDIDPRHTGDESWERLAEGRDLPATWETVTGSRGRHLWYRYDARAVGRVPSSVGRLGAGVDVCADGGLVVVAPSRHVSGGTYGWELSSDPADVPLAACPAWLLAVILGARAPSPPAGVGGRRGEGAAAGERIPAGARNVTLYRLACGWRSRGLDAPELLEALTATSDAQCDPPMAATELAALVRSAMTRDAGRSPEAAARAAATEAAAARAEVLGGRYPHRATVAHYQGGGDVPDDPAGGVQW